MFANFGRRQFVDSIYLEPIGLALIKDNTDRSHSINN